MQVRCTKKTCFIMIHNVCSGCLNYITNTLLLVRHYPANVQISLTPLKPLRFTSFLSNKIRLSDKYVKMPKKCLTDKHEEVY